MELKDRVKVTKVEEEKMMNLWGGYDDVTTLLGQSGVITRILNPDTKYQQYGIEFDDYFAQITRERTGIIFSENQLEFI